MNSFFNNPGPSYQFPSQTPTGGNYKPFLDFPVVPNKGDQQLVDGQHSQSGTFPQQPLLDSTSLQPQEILAHYEPYVVNRHTYKPNIRIENYGSEGAIWAGYDSAGGTVYPLDTLHTQWKPNTISVDDVPSRQTEILSSVLQTEENFTIQPLGSFRSPSPPLDGSSIAEAIPYLISASPPSSSVPPPGTNSVIFQNSGPTTIMANIAASGSMQGGSTDRTGPSRCNFPKCANKASGARPFLTPRHQNTEKHRKQQLPKERAELPLMYECVHCDYQVHRKHTYRRHTKSQACQLRGLEFIKSGVIKKSGRSKGGKKMGERVGNPMVVTARC